MRVIKKKNLQHGPHAWREEDFSPAGNSPTQSYTEAADALRAS